MDKRHLFTKGTRQIRRDVRLKKYCTNFDARRRIRYIRASNNALIREKCLLALLCERILINVTTRQNETSS
jgi:hypothetical protein